MLRALTINEEYVVLIIENEPVKADIIMISNKKFYEFQGGLHKVSDLV